jgi:hypothetical protein
MRTRLSSSRADQSGFTLAEMAVGLAVGMFVLVSTISFLSRTIGVVQKLNIERDIRDQGIMAVETIEREFRKVLEYGGSFDIDSDTETLMASFGTRDVKIEKTGSDIVLTSGGEVTVFDGIGKCTSFTVKALVGDNYVTLSDENADQARVIVIEFELGDDSHGISRSFKAAFSSVNATGS